MADPTADRDQPLKEDTRLLGRLLGDVLRDQTGDAGYGRVEAIRQTAIRFRRAGAEPCFMHECSGGQCLRAGFGCHVLRREPAQIASAILSGEDGAEAPEDEGNAVLPQVRAPREAAPATASEPRLDPEPQAALELF